MATGFDGGHPFVRPHGTGSRREHRLFHQRSRDTQAPNRSRKGLGAGAASPVGGHRWILAERANRRRHPAKKSTSLRPELARSRSTLTARTGTVTISGPPNLHEIAASDESAP